MGGESRSDVMVDAGRLTAWARSVFEGFGFSEEDAGLVATALVDTDLRGVKTHGVAQIPHYAGLFARGALNPRPQVDIRGDGPLLHVTGDRGLGHVVVQRLLPRAIQIAARDGICAVTIAEVGHLGALGFFTRLAAEQGLVALMVQNSFPTMGLPGFRKPAIGNNPVAYSAQVAGRAPIVFDVATSEAAVGKIAQAKAAKRPIPEGWALDPQGRPTTDPAAALSGLLLPSGGVKGIGLAMLVDVLAGSLSGQRPSPETGLFGAFLLLIDPAKTVGRAAFDADMAEWLATYEAAGEDAHYPGARAAARFAEQSSSGIGLAAPVYEALTTLSDAAGLPFEGVVLAGQA